MSLNNQHAARLREIRADLLSMDSDTPDAASLLAGAEALEAVDVAKAALKRVNKYGGMSHRYDADEYRCYDQCPLCAVTAALARLEGK